MKTPFKILLALVALLVFALVGLTIAVALIFEPNDYRPILVNAIERNTGRSLDIQGDIGLRLFPCCGVAIGRATLGNPDGFPSGAFAKVDAATLSLKIWPLLVRREVQIGTVTLEKPDLALLRLADGRTNWEFGDSAALATAPDASGSMLGDLTIAGLYVREGRLSYQDLENTAAYSVANIELETGTIGPGLSFDVRTSLTVTEEASAISADLQIASILSLPNNASKLVASGLDVTFGIEDLASLNADVDGRLRIQDLELDVDAMTGSMTSAELNLQASGFLVRLTGSGRFDAKGAQMSGRYELPAAPLRQFLDAISDEPYRPADPAALMSLSGSGSWILQPQSFRFEDVNLLLDDTRLTGSAAIEDFDAAAIMFDLQADQIDLDRYLDPTEPTSVPLGALGDTQIAGKLKFGRLRSEQVDFTTVELTLGSSGGEATIELAGRALDGRFNMTGGGNVAATEPYLAGSMSLMGLSPRKLLAAQGESPTTAAPGVLAELSGKAQWRLGPRSLLLEQMSLQLDQTRITGSLRIDDFDRPATRFDLALDRMNLDAYLEPDSDDPETEIPVDIIRDLTTSGRLLAGELTIFDVKLLNLSANMSAANGVLRLAPLRAGVFGGEYSANITIDATGDRAKLNLDQQISAVQVGEVLRTFYDTDRLAGALTMQLKGNGTGNTQTELLKALSADFSLNLSDGAYRGMDIMYEVRNARALLRRETPPPAPTRKETPIRELAVSGRVLDGVLRSDNLNAATAFMQLAGKGGVNLLEQSLDYQLVANVLRIPEIASGGDLSDLLNIDIPLTIKGPMMGPKVGVDLKNVATTVVREKVKERARDALLERLESGRKDKQPATPSPDPAPADPEQAQPPALPAATAEETQADPEVSAKQQRDVKDATKRDSPKQDSPKDMLKRGLRDLLNPPIQPVEQGEDRQPPP